MSLNEIRTDKEIVLRFINEITKDWHQFCDQAGKFEIRCLGENRTPITQIFTLEEVADAADFSKRMNTIKLNVYMMINLINPEAVIKAGKGARKENILRAHYSFADADDVQGLNGLSMLSNLQAPDIIVTTGTIPHKRQHAYWHFAEPCYDLKLWGTTQRRIASEFKTDNAVVDLSRVMRLPGTVSYPSVAKQAKKYVPELVTMTMGIS